MKLFKKDSVEDLILRGHSYKQIKDIYGFPPENYKKKLSSVKEYSQNEQMISAFPEF